MKIDEAFSLGGFSIATSIKAHIPIEELRDKPEASATEVNINISIEGEMWFSNPSV